MNTLKFETETIKRFYGDSTEDIIDILNQYLSSKEEMLNSLCTSFVAGPAELHNSLHFHSSVFTYVGFPQLSQDFIEFENECKTSSTNKFLELRFNNLLGKIMESTVIARQELERLEKLCSC